MDLINSQSLLQYLLMWYSGTFPPAVQVVWFGNLFHLWIRDSLPSPDTTCHADFQYGTVGGHSCLCLCKIGSLPKAGENSI